MRTRNADTPKSGDTKRTPPQKKNAAAEKTPETAPKSTPKSTPKTTRAGKGKQAAAKTPDPEAETQVVEMGTPEEEKKPSAVVNSPGKKPSAKKSPLSVKPKKDEPPPELETEGKEAEVVERKEDEKEAVEKKEDGTEGVEKKEDEKEEKKEDGKVAVEKEEDKNEVAAGEEEPMEEVVKKEEGKKEEIAETNQDTSLDEKGEVAAEEEELMEAVAAEEEPMEEVAPEDEAFVEPNDEEIATADAIGGGDEVAGGAEVGDEGQGQDQQDQHQEGVAVEVDEQMEISDMAKARKIKKEQEIFVGGLDRDATEEDVKKEFEKAGEVVEVRILKDFTTNKNKGFAFVKYASKEEATKALTELKNPMIRGKRCGIAPSEDNDTLFLGNICNTWTKEAIRRKLKDYGIDSVVSITMVADTQNEGLSRGFAFVEFSCHADAMVAYKRLQKPDVIFGHPERTAKVAFAVPLREPDPEVLAQVKSVFIDGLPPYWDEDRVKERFKGYGEIERVVLARNMSTAKRKDFGFVNFTTHESAVTCIEGVNNTELGDGKSKTKARARLANPLPKTQAVKGGMSGGFRIGNSGIGGYPRFGRGFGRGRFPSHRAGFQGGTSHRAGFQGGASHRAGFHGGRGFVPRGRARGRFPFAVNNELDPSYTEFSGGWRPFEARGGRRSTSARRGGFERGRGRGFPSRREPFPLEEDFSRPFGARYPAEDPYFYGDAAPGIKRPFSMMEHDPGYLDPRSRIRPRYDHPDPMTARAHWRDPLGAPDLYSRDYYGSDSDYGSSTYPTRYGGGPSGSGYYY